MHTGSLFEAKTHLSRIVEDLLSGKEDRIVSAHRGKPAVCVTSVRSLDTSRRVGLARGLFEVPDDIEAANPDIATLFQEGR